MAVKFAFVPSDEGRKQLEGAYRRAFNGAVELYILTAYLTTWDGSLKLNAECLSFRLIVGKDFGITRKQACLDVLRWLPSTRKSQFLVADSIRGFHPKAIFWREKSGKYFSIIGSSNLTKAAFETNYEANIFSEISQEEYFEAREWIRDIESQCIVLSEDWLEKYSEAPIFSKGGQRQGKHRGNDDSSLIVMKLPMPMGVAKQITYRRKALKAFRKYKEGLVDLFKNCAEGKISNKEFYSSLPDFWGFERQDRLQGLGWERQGKSSNFVVLSKSALNIIKASDSERDDVVSLEMDKLQKKKVKSRTAFFSEILCLLYPDLYPIVNSPVKKYLSAIRYRAPRAASEGSRYIHLAKMLRQALVCNPKHPAKNLAEIDAVIWLKYHKKKMPKLVQKLGESI